MIVLFSIVHVVTNSISCSLLYRIGCFATSYIVYNPCAVSRLIIIYHVDYQLFAYR